MIGPLITIGGFILDARELIALGLPAVAWQAIGFVIFVLVMIVLLVGVTREQRHVTTTLQGLQIGSADSTSRSSITAQERPKTYFHDQQLYTSELARNEDVLRDKIFERCEIIGPALIFFGGNTRVEGCGFAGKIDEILFEVPEGRRLVGGIAFVNCIFRRCEFKRIGVLVTPPQLETFKDDFAKSKNQKS